MIVVRNERIRQIYKRSSFPFIDAASGTGVPQASLYHQVKHVPGTTTAPEPCDHHIWLDGSIFRQGIEMTEQVRIQRDGHALILLHAVTTSDEDDGDIEATDQRFARY